MKLVAKRGSEDSARLLVGDWQVDPDCTWLSVWWEPTEEDYINKSGKRTGSYHGGEHGFPQLVSSFIPEGSVVYADFSFALSERPAMIADLEERGFRYEIPGRSGREGKLEPEKTKRKHWWTGLLMRERGEGSVYAEVDRDFMASAFKGYVSWQVYIWNFLVCQKPFSNWAEQLSKVSRNRLMSKELLMGIDLFLCNHWEHGLELLSTNLSHEQLIEMAKEACTKLNWQLEIRTS